MLSIVGETSVASFAVMKQRHSEMEGTRLCYKDRAIGRAPRSRVGHACIRVILLDASSALATPQSIHNRIITISTIQ